MSRTLPPLGWFRSFESAAQHGSFTAAADELGLTQSAVSQQIRLLEARLGCRLFDRNPRGISLTDDGRKLLPEIIRAIDTLRSATQPYEQSQSRLLTIATSVSVAQWYLAPHLHEFLADRPELDVRLLTTVWPDGLADSTDVQIRFGANEGQPSLGRNRLVLVASPQQMANESLPLSEAALQRYTLIQAVGTSDNWGNRANQFGLSSAHPTSVYVDSHGLSVDLARAGSGIALTSELIAMPLLVSGALVTVSDATPEAVDGYFINAVDSSNAQAKEFVDWLQCLVNTDLT
jgi:LysR family glycine cleavage system transcriptional activator